MFGNLKSKLGDVADLKKYASPQVLNSLTGSRQRSGQHTPGTQTPSLPRHSRQPSDSSLTGAASTSISYNTLLEQNESNENENKDTEKLERELKKLKSTLETQQDAALQRLNTKEQEWRTRLEQEHKKYALLEEELKNTKNREELTHKQYVEKENENSVCNQHILGKDDVENKLINLQDNYDQLEGLSTQEGAKIKHLLLNTTSELEKSRSEVLSKSSEMEGLLKRLSNFEGIEEKIHALSEEKMDLETKVAGLSQKLNAANSRLLSESENHVEEMQHLRERISVLDKRSSQGSMEDTERNEAINKEREAYEHKLEESRQQLSNIKSSWSDKITALETQIQNLNQKMAEDQADLKTCEERNEELGGEILSLKEERRVEGERHVEEVTSLRQECDRWKEDLETARWQVQTETSKKTQEVKELRRSMHLQEEKCNQLTEELTSKKEENLNLAETLSSSSSNVDELETKAKSLETKCSSLQTSNAALQEHLSRESATLESVNQELEALKEKFEVVCLERSKLSSNLDKYVEKVTDYESTIKRLEEEKVRGSERLKETEEELGEMRCKGDVLEGFAKQVEADFEAKVEGSKLVLDLRESLKQREDEILDKKQMLKVQSQRLADMKKTIQRELKINPESAESGLPNHLNSHQVNSRLHSHPPPSPPRPLDPKSFGKKSPDQKSPGQNLLAKMQQRVNETQNGDHEIDPVNLEYLKHVVIKFITSREYEAVQLTRAVSTLLRMSPAEESLLRETLEWKMSWFGSRPHSGGKGGGVPSAAGASYSTFSPSSSSLFPASSGQ